MPIQIRELIVTAMVEEEKAGLSPQSPPQMASAQDPEEKSALIQACVDEVLKVLKQQTRR